MSYMHIENLYRSQEILLFRECYAMEKVHGTSAHVGWGRQVTNEGPSLTFFSGGASQALFQSIFDKVALAEAFAKTGLNAITVYGEAYGGSQQKMKHVYGESLRFIAFDVCVGVVDGAKWLSVPDMAQLCEELGFEVVPYEKVSTDLACLDAIRDKPSEVAVRRGCGDHPREGVVLRPLIELTKNNGSRIIAKHKGEAFAERATPPKVVDADKLAVLANAEAIATEWVTPMRLTHVLDKIEGGKGIEATPVVIKAMIEDVTREAAGEIVDSKEARSAIGKRTAALFKDWVKAQAFGGDKS